MPAQYAHPSDNVSPLGVWEVLAGALQAGFPITNINDLNPAKPVKATGTSLTVRVTYGVAQLVKAIVLVTHNLFSATIELTNNAGMATQAIVPLANHEDGHSVNPFKDLSAVANNTATQWDLTITGAAANVAIGEILLLSEWRTLSRNVRWGLRDRDRHPAIVHRTFAGVRKVADVGVKMRRLTASIEATDVGRTALLSLARDASGCVKNWPFVLDPLINDARFLHFEDPDIESTLQFLDSNPTSLVLEEESRGLAL